MLTRLGRTALIAPLLLSLSTAGAHGLPGVRSADAGAIELPELGRSADLVADRGTEERLGQAFLRQLRSSAPLWQDPLIRDYIEQLTYRLALHSPLQNPRFSLVVIDDRSINAFAVPGGVLGVNTGLILTAETEGELAGVMSHELGHLSQRHFARNVEANRFNQWLALGGLLASIAAAAAGGSAGGDLGLAVGASTQALALQNRLAYSRAFEQEADRIGMQTLTLAGYDPRDMPNFFLRLERSTRQLGFVPEFLRTHPLSTTRLADLERRVNSSQRPPRRDDLPFRLIQTRLQVAYSTQLRDMIQAFEQSLADGQAPVTTRYGLALAYLRDGQPDRARSLLEPLLKADPQRLDYLVTALDIAFQSRDFAAGLAIGDNALSLYPGQRALVQRQGRLALALGRPGRIRLPLEDLLRQHDNDVDLWRLRADVALAERDTLNVFRARAEVFFLTNQLRAAEDQLQNALRLAAGNYSLSAQLQKRLEDMRRLDAEFRR